MYIHESAKWVSTGFATVATLGSYSGDQILAWTGTVIAVLSAVCSWMIAERSRLRQARREQRWTDAVLDWQIDELRKGHIQRPPPLPDPPPIPMLEVTDTQHNRRADDPKPAEPAPKV